MNDKEIKLAADMLRLASTEFSNHGCNDVDKSLYKGWTSKERKNFAKEIQAWTGNPDDDEQELPDWMLMRFLAHQMAPENKR